MIRHAVAAAVAALLAVSVASAQDAPPAATQEGPKHDLSPRLKDGQPIPVIWKIQDVLKVDNGDFGKFTTTFNLGAEMELAPGKEDKGKTKAVLVVNRVYGDLDDPEASGKFDTAIPKSVKLSSGADSYVAKMSQARMNLLLDVSGKVKESVVDEATTKGLPDCFKESLEKEDKVKAVCSLLKNLGSEPFAYIPPATVAVDTTWSVQKQVVYIDFSGLPVRIDEVSDCKLIQIEKSDDGRVAVVEITGKIELPDRDKKKDIAAYEVFGHLRTNLDKPGAVHWRVQLVGRMKADNGVNDKKIHTIVTEVITGANAKAAFRPAATQPATQPETTRPTTLPAAGK